MEGPLYAKKVTGSGFFTPKDLNFPKLFADFSTYVAMVSISTSSVGFTLKLLMVWVKTGLYGLAFILG
jgi:hypothetical protein